MAFQLTSSAFASGAPIPKQYTCDSADQSPPLQWSDAPAGTQSLALIVEDPDAPGGTFVHWVLYRIAPEPTALPAALPKQAEFAEGMRQGRNSFRRVGYGGPCPPRGATHHYHFHLYALNRPLDLTPGASVSEVRAAMTGQIIAEAELIGIYGR